MSADGDTLLARAAAVIENARDVRNETQRVIDNARLHRLNRELITKMLQIQRLVSLADRKANHRLH